jgi:hypothetical protein
MEDTMVIHPTAERAARETATGPAAAALAAAGGGALVFGLLTLLAGAFSGIKAILGFIPAVGSLSGKAILAVAAWLVLWPVLHFLWRDSDARLHGACVATAVMIAVSAVCTFPPVFEAFH